MPQTTNSLPLVVIFGRTNVGKSTLFNRLSERSQALVSSQEGTTRDSNIGQVNWRGKKFYLIDTGGIIDLKYLTGKTVKTNEIEAKVQEQARLYLKRADLILFLVDTKAGLLPQDKDLARLLKKIIDPKKIILIANKLDSIKQMEKTAEFYKLSLADPLPVSAATGLGTGDLLDVIIKRLRSRKAQRPENKEKTKKELQIPNYELRDATRVCIIGKPNVGKSSFLNSILGYERVIVSPTPHTTREPQDTYIIYQNQTIKLIDTAGISKKAAKSQGLEKAGIIKSLTALKKSDIALLVLDISQPITQQDLKLIDEIMERQKSFIIIANKWDIIKIRDTKKFTNYIYSHLPFAKFSPIQFVSALTGEKVNKILDLILKISEERKKQLSDSQLNKFLSHLVKIHRPAKGRGTKYPHIYEIRQIKANPPFFQLRIGPKQDLHFSYVRFIENRLRENFSFLGTPINIKVIKK